MLYITNNELINKAKDVSRLHNSSEYVSIGGVGCALISDKNNIYQGVSINANCGVGFCAEYGAIAGMITNKEYKIKKIVTVSEDGIILPPCGRCRELIYQIDEKNLNTDVIIGKNKIIKLKNLLPHLWQKKIDKKHS